MSSPLWMWSPRSSPYGLVTVPLLTGVTIRPSDVQPPPPVAGAELGAGAGAGSEPVDGDGVSTLSRRSERSERSGPPVGSDDGDDDGGEDAGAGEGVSAPAEAITVCPDDDGAEESK